MRKGFTLIELMIVIAIIAIIAAIAIPNLLESRVTANESAASASLKAGVFAGQVQFQGGGYLDRDQDNVGEYGTLRMLSGIESTSKNPAGSIRLLQGPLANTASWSSIGTNAATNAPGFGGTGGFNFAAMVPSDTDATSEDTEGLYVDGAGVTGTDVVASIAATDATANQGERGWAAAAIPQEWGNTGRRVFTIGGDGQIRSPAAPAVQNGIFSGSTNALNNGDKPASVGAALGRAIATALGNAVATTVAAVTTTMFDGTTYNGLPIFTK